MTEQTTGTILAINAGSSSVKFQLFDRSADLKLLAHGSVNNLGGTPSFSATDEKTQVADKKSLPDACTHENALRLILEWIEKQGEDRQVNAIVSSYCPWRRNIQDARSGHAGNHRAVENLRPACALA